MPELDGKGDRRRILGDLRHHRLHLLLAHEARRDLPHHVDQRPEADHQLDIALLGKPGLDRLHRFVARERLGGRVGPGRRLNGASIHIGTLAEGDHDAVVALLDQAVEPARAEDELLGQTLVIDPAALRHIDDRLLHLKRGNDVARFELLLGVPRGFATNAVDFARQRLERLLHACDRVGRVARGDEERAVVEHAADGNPELRRVRRHLHRGQIGALGKDPFGHQRPRRNANLHVGKIQKFAKLGNAAQAVDINRKRQIERVLRDAVEARGLAIATGHHGGERGDRLGHANGGNEDPQRIDIDHHHAVSQHVDDFEALGSQSLLLAAIQRAAGDIVGNRLQARALDRRAQRIARGPGNEIGSIEPTDFGGLQPSAKALANAVGRQRRGQRLLGRRQRNTVVLQRAREDDCAVGAGVSAIALVGRGRQIRLQKGLAVGRRNDDHRHRPRPRRLRDCPSCGQARWEVRHHRALLIKIGADAQLRLEQVDRPTHRKQPALTSRLNELRNIVAQPLEARHGDERNRLLRNPRQRAVERGQISTHGQRRRGHERETGSGARQESGHSPYSTASAAFAPFHCIDRAGCCEAPPPRNNHAQSNHQSFLGRPLPQHRRRHRPRHRLRLRASRPADRRAHHEMEGRHFARNQSQDPRWQGRQPRRVRRQGHARGECRKPVRIHRPVRGPAEGLRQVQGPRPCHPRLSQRRFRRTGVRRPEGDQGILLDEVQRYLPDLREVQGQVWRRTIEGLRMPRHQDRRTSGLELRQVCGFSRRKDRAVLRVNRGARKRAHDRGDREGPR